MGIIHEKNPWFYAQAEGRSYITPGDITSAIRAGVTRIELSEIVLQALSRKLCEDWSLCAFVTVEFKP